MSESLTEKQLELFRHYIEVVEHLCKERPAGIAREQVKPDCLYVVDWLTEKPDRYDGIKVECVTAVNGEEVCIRGSSYTSLDTFASIVVAGPFSLLE